MKQSMLKALGNVAPRHLLDTRLNPPAELRRHAAPDRTAIAADRKAATADLKRRATMLPLIPSA